MGKNCGATISTAGMTTTLTRTPSDVHSISYRRFAFYFYFYFSFSFSFNHIFFIARRGRWMAIGRCQSPVNCEATFIRSITTPTTPPFVVVDPRSLSYWDEQRKKVRASAEPMAIAQSLAIYLYAASFNPIPKNWCLHSFIYSSSASAIRFRNPLPQSKIWRHF